MFGSVNEATLCSATEFSPASAFDVGEQELLTLRLSISIQPDLTICEKHAARIRTMFDLHQKKCCDPFRKHKKTITSKVVIYIQEGCLMNDDFLLYLQNFFAFDFVRSIALHFECEHSLLLPC